MDGKVSDFFNEIDNIIPTKESTPEWQECYDESTGYPYYWNTKTDAVCWDVPANYKKLKPKSNGNAPPPRPAPLFPSTAPLTHKKQDSSAHRTPNFTSSGRGEEKTILLTSYGDDSDSEDESLPTIAKTKIETSTVVSGTKLPTKSFPHLSRNQSPKSASDSDKEENSDLLTHLQKRALVLKKLGGELPASLKKIVEHNGCDEPSQDTIKVQTRKDVTGFSLVAGYSDSDSDDEFVHSSLKPENKTVAPSPLFPLAKPIDVAQFTEPKKETPAPLPQSIDTKAFQRKRRIGLDFIDNKTKIQKPEGDRLGLGFKQEKDDESNKYETKAGYPGFKSAGLMFLKPEPDKVDSDSEKKIKLIKSKQIHDTNKKYSVQDIKKIEEAHKSVSEKLHFLSEGREAATPVQTMIIQLETLLDAMKANSLSIDYLYKWLQDTFTELAKLEKGAAPSGWILKWDRIVKRYYYRNQQSGDCQWEYPQPDIVGGDEAMDISTTPPPPPVVEEPPPPPPSEPMLPVVCYPSLPPPPPRIKSPTPPPPPSISDDNKIKPKGKIHTKRLLSPKKPALPTDSYQSFGEPLPPGVDLPPVDVEPPVAVALVTQAPEDPLGSALNSFYSDLASMETAVPVPVPTYITPIIQNPILPNSTITPEKTVKKKKTKVKIVEGLAMKKKGVSKLVEKWKSVQKEY